MTGVKILLFAATRSPIGGVATWLDQFYWAMTRAGAEVTVALVKGRVSNSPDQFLRYHPGIHHCVVDGTGLNREGRIRICQKTIQTVDADIVIPLGVLDACYATIREKRRKTHLYLVGHAQGNLPAMLADLEDTRDGIDHMVCVGELTKKYLIGCAGFSADRVNHIPNGAKERTTPRIPSEGPLQIGYIGRLTQTDKRVHDLPLLCATLQSHHIDYELTVVGGGPEEEALREALAPFGKKVVMTGVLSSEKIYSEILPQLEILVLFSSSETFGIVLAEAMMNGVVPVTSRYAGFESERLVVEGEHGLSFPVGDMEKAAKAIQRLDNDREQWLRLSHTGEQHVQTHYSWPASMNAWQETIENTLKQRAITPPPQLANEIRQETNGRLDRLWLPATIKHRLRLMRVKTVGAPTSSDGEEWPLMNRFHGRDRLDTVEAACAKLEDAAREEEKKVSV